MTSTTMKEFSQQVTGLKEKSMFDTLNEINVNGHTEEKNGLTYLSWAWAWGELKKVYPDAQYTIERFGEDKKPYLYDENLGYMVFTSMTINGLTHEMWLPVMDGANKAMKKHPYTYKGYKYEKGKKVWNKQTNTWELEDKVVEPATMFDINKTIMRCLVKNIGMFGLGLYIYAGEDLPNVEKEEAQEVPTTETVEAVKRLLAECRKVNIDLANDKNVAKFIADNNGGKTNPNEMNEKELQNYMAVLKSLINSRTNASNSK